MYRTLTLSLVMALMSAPFVSSANDEGATLTGALLGAAGGLIVANNADHVSRAVAVPVGALAGGLIANAAWNHRHDYGYHYYGYPRYRRYHPRRYYRYPPRVVVVKEVEKKYAEMPQPANLQPGVDLIKISVPFSSGVAVDIPILRMGDKFVGPQGEEYTSLPTAKELAGKYAK